MDNRKTIRLPLIEEIVYTYNKKQYKGQALDISHAGLRFDAGRFIPPMTKIQVTVDLDPKITFNGVTIWSSKNGTNFSVGLLFKDMNDDLEYHLSMLLKKIAPSE